MYKELLQQLFEIKDEFALNTFLKSFADKNNLNFLQDKAGNVVISKYKNRPPILFYVEVEFVNFSNKRLIKKGDFIEFYSALSTKTALSLVWGLKLLQENLSLELVVAKGENLEELGFSKLKSRDVITFNYGEENKVYSENYSFLDGVLKINSEKIFIPSYSETKTYKIELSGVKNDNLNKIMLDLLNKIKGVNINKYFYENAIFAVLTTDEKERTLKKVVKYFYLQTKKIYKTFKLKCIKLVDSTLVLKESDSFQNILRLLSQKNILLSFVDSDRGLVKFTMFEKNKSLVKEKFNLLEDELKKYKIDVHKNKIVENYNSTCSSLTKRLNIYGTEDFYPYKSFGGLFQDKIKDCNIVTLSTKFDKNDFNTFSYSSFVNNFITLKNILLV